MRVRADDRNAGNGKLSCSEHESCASPPSGGPHTHRAAAATPAIPPRRGRPEGPEVADQASHISICERDNDPDTVLADYTRGGHGDGSLPLVAAKMDVEALSAT